MVAKAWAEREGAARKKGRSIPPTGDSSGVASRGVEERFIQNESVSICVLMNRRTKTMRVIDFRAGPSHAKREFVLQLARREGIEKIYTVVERDEVSTWCKLGFSREAALTGFYKRSDAFILGCVVSAAQGSTLRVPIGIEEDDEPDADVAAPAHDFAEKTVMQAKRLAKELASDRRALPAPKLSVVSGDEPGVKRAIDKALRSGRALTAFEPFGRDVTRAFFHLTSRGGFELIASTESQACFGSAFIELLTGPANEAETTATASALRVLCDRLLRDGIVSGFGLTPSDDVALATAFAWSGFRRTGLLEAHLTVRGVRKDAIVWARKLANPTAD